MDNRKQQLLRSLRIPILPSKPSRVIHPSINGLPRERGTYWWTAHQLELEDAVATGFVLEHGTFYVFLEEECMYDKVDATVRYGNVYMTDHWITMIDVAPKAPKRTEVR
jgi:hypothetical protein